MAVFARWFPSLDPDRETIARFDALLALIPRLRQFEEGEPVDEFEEMTDRAAREAAVASRLESPDAG